MKKIYLQYPWKFPDSPYYESLVDNPPKGFNYLNAHKQKGVITTSKKFWFSNFLKRNIRRLIQNLKLPIINVHKTKIKEPFDLIHCAHCLSKNKKTPWVADIEMVSSILLTHKVRNSQKTKALKYLTQKNCMKILPWTEYTKKELLTTFPEIKDKLEVIYPAVPLNKQKKKKTDKIKILYATRYFWLKGGYIALEVYRKLKEKYGQKVELIFISDVPEEIKNKYPEINVSPLVPQNIMKRLYETSDIFFYPSFVDTFGFGILEAMSYGIPIISLNTNRTKTRPEILENNIDSLYFDVNDKITDKVIESQKNLFVTDEEKKIIDQLFQNTCKLIDNQKLRSKLSINCIKKIKTGRFSLVERNKRLRNVYNEAISSKK